MDLPGIQCLATTAVHHAVQDLLFRPEHLFWWWHNAVELLVHHLHVVHQHLERKHLLGQLVLRLEALQRRGHLARRVLLYLVHECVPKAVSMYACVCVCVYIYISLYICVYIHILHI